MRAQPVPDDEAEGGSSFQCALASVVRPSPKCTCGVFLDMNRHTLGPRQGSGTRPAAGGWTCHSGIDNRRRPSPVVPCGEGRVEVRLARPPGCHPPPPPTHLPSLDPPIDPTPSLQPPGSIDRRRPPVWCLGPPRRLERARRNQSPDPVRVSPLPAPSPDSRPAAASAPKHPAWREGYLPYLHAAVCRRAAPAAKKPSPSIHPSIHCPSPPLPLRPSTGYTLAR